MFIVMRTRATGTATISAPVRSPPDVETPDFEHIVPSHVPPAFAHAAAWSGGDGAGAGAGDGIGLFKTGPGAGAGAGAGGGTHAPAVHVPPTLEQASLSLATAHPPEGPAEAPIGMCLA